MSLMSLDEYRNHTSERYKHKHATGIACPNCGDELQDTMPGVVMCSSPPQKRVKCFECNYETNIQV